MSERESPARLPAPPACFILFTPMEHLSDGALAVVVQNMQLALDYQYQQLDHGTFDPADAADAEAHLAQVEQVLGTFKAEYERRAVRNPRLTPLPRLGLSPPMP